MLAVPWFTPKKVIKKEHEKRGKRVFFSRIIICTFRRECWSIKKKKTITENFVTFEIHRKSSFTLSHQVFLFFNLFFNLWMRIKCRSQQRTWITKAVFLFLFCSTIVILYRPFHNSLTSSSVRAHCKIIMF